MLRHAEGLAFVNRHDLIDAIAKNKTSVEHRNFCLRQWAKNAVDIDGWIARNTLNQHVLHHLFCSLVRSIDEKLFRLTEPQLYGVDSPAYKAGTLDRLKHLKRF